MIVSMRLHASVDDADVTDYSHIILNSWTSMDRESFYFTQVLIGIVESGNVFMDSCLINARSSLNPWENEF